MIDEKNAQTSTYTAMEDFPSRKRGRIAVSRLKLIFNAPSPDNLLPGQPDSEVRKNGQKDKRKTIDKVMRHLRVQKIGPESQYGLYGLFINYYYLYDNKYGL